MPKGKETFKMCLEKEGKQGIGKIHLADTGFVDPRWSTAVIEAISKDCILVTAYLQVYKISSMSISLTVCFVSLVANGVTTLLR